MLTEVYNNDPALHERNDPPAPRNLVEYLRACKFRIEHCIDIRHAEHESESHGEGGQKADAHR